MKCILPVILLLLTVSNGFLRSPSNYFRRVTSIRTLSRFAVAKPREDLRNVAIIAHVDHGKTTLVDSMIRQSGAFRENQEISSMDSNDLERERGITILAKNTAIMYQNTKINIVDTPGHADFGGEVERIMNMVDGVLLVVDSVDGPKPQTKFVLRKALEKGVKAIVVINKIDRPQARPNYVLDRIFDLFLELNANEEQMDFRTVYASGLRGISGLRPESLTDNLNALFDEILKLPKPVFQEDHPLQLLIANIDYNEFKGKLGIGRIINGNLKAGDEILYGKPPSPVPSAEVQSDPATSATADDGGGLKRGKISELFVFHNAGKEKVNEASAGEIVVVSGIRDITIGDTITSKDQPMPLPPIKIEEPTVRMYFGVNKSPLAGREGKFLQSNAIRDRLTKELDRNVALRVYSTDNADKFEVCGRGQLHLTVLIESMRREGFELMISPPTVIRREIDGVLCEPFELLDMTVPNDYTSTVISRINERRGEMIEFTPLEGTEGYSQLKYLLSTRAMIGLRSELLTATKGRIVLDSIFDSYRPVVSGSVQARDRGSLLATEDGTATTYGILHAQERGRLFISPRAEVFKDMIVGVHQRPGDLSLNVCKAKQLTNMRSAGAEELEKLVPPMELNLEIAVEYIQDDELVEVTPTKIRMMKNPSMRRK